jgi:hypothetical protein
MKKHYVVAALLISGAVFSQTTPDSIALKILRM